MNDEENIYSAILTWWNELNYLKGDRAEIRRCSTLDEIQLLSGFYNLRSRLDKVTQEKIDNEHLALIAGVLVNIKTSLNTTEKTTNRTKVLARLMGKTYNGGTPSVNLNRFQSILKTTDLNDLYRQLIVVLPLIGKQAYIPQLINDLRFWSDSIKKTWAEAYYL